MAASNVGYVDTAPVFIGKSIKKSETLDLLDLSSELQPLKQIIRVLQEELSMVECVMESELGARNKPTADDQMPAGVESDRWLHILSNQQKRPKIVAEVPHSVF